MIMNISARDVTFLNHTKTCNKKGTKITQTSFLVVKLYFGPKLALALDIIIFMDLALKTYT